RKPVRMSPARQAPKPEATKKWLCPDLDGGNGEGPAFEGELEITDTRQALAAAIDDLRIQDVACQQELVMRERGIGQFGCARERDSATVECRDRMTRDIGDAPLSAAYPQTNDAWMRIEANDEVE